MITEAIVAALAGLLTVIGNLMPTMDTPAFFGDVAGAVGTIAGNVAGLGAWVPLGQVDNVMSFLIACISIALTVKIVRIAVSLFTGGGGGAA